MDISSVNYVLSYNNNSTKSFDKWFDKKYK